MAVLQIMKSSYDSSTKQEHVEYKDSNGNIQKTNVDLKKGEVYVDHMNVPGGANSGTTVIVRNPDGTQNMNGQKIIDSMSGNKNVQFDSNCEAPTLNQGIQEFNKILPELQIDPGFESHGDPGFESYGDLIDTLISNTSTPQQKADSIRRLAQVIPESYTKDNPSLKTLRNLPIENITSRVDKDGNIQLVAKSIDGSSAGSTYDNDKLGNIDSTEAGGFDENSLGKSTNISAETDKNGISRVNYSNPDGTKSQVVTKCDTEAQLKQADAVTKNINSTMNQTEYIENAQRLSNDFSVVEGMGKHRTLTRGNGKFYGKTGSLVFPSDLLTNNQYNNSYTMIFISEHEQSSICGTTGITVGSDEKRLVNNAGSQMHDYVNAINKMDQGSGTKTSDVLVPAISAYAAFKGVGWLAGQAGTKLMSDGVLKGFTNMNGGGKAAELAAGWYMTGAKAAFGLGAAYAFWNANDGTTMKDLKTALKLSDYKQLKLAIALPTPSIAENNSVSWETSDTMISGGIASLMAHGLNIGALFGNMDKNAPTNIDPRATQEKLQSMTQGNSGLKGAFAAALQAATLGSAVTAAPAIAKMMGKAVNTRKEQLFKDVQFRDLNLSFRMAIRSKEDADNIESIVKALKFHMYPELIASEFVWIYPAEFDIVHYYNGKVNPHMPRHTSCVLKSVNLKYGDDNAMNFHYDGTPTSVTMDLAFTEIAQLNKESVMKGY